MTQRECIHCWLIRAESIRPDAPAVITVNQGAPDSIMSFRQVTHAAAVMAASLRRLGARRNDRIILSLPNDFQFLVALCAISQLGAVAVPAPVPDSVSTERFELRLRAIVDACTPSIVVTRDAYRDAFFLLDERRIQVAAVETLSLDVHEPLALPRCSGDTRIIQFTSGSTNSPKGVVLTGTMMAAACQQAIGAYGDRTSDVAVTWVPLYHDMGLVTGVLRPLYSMYTAVLLTPRHFISQPIEWLRAIHRRRGTLISAPNFAYDFCTAKVPKTPPDQLDLSSLRVARNAGEPISAKTCSDFQSRFAENNLRKGAMAPSYGLAEATLTVSATSAGCAPIHLLLDRQSIRNGVLKPAEPGDPQPFSVMSSGAPVAGCKVRIERNKTVGRIVISGPQLARKYWGKRVRLSKWFKTGDIGFIEQNQLFVLGRIDETIVWRGENYFSSDFVEACRSVPGLRKGKAFAFLDSDSGSLTVVSEVSNSGDHNSLEGLRRDLVRKIVERVGVAAHVTLVASGSLPVTTSGKVQVLAARRRLQSGKLEVVPKITSND